MSKGDATYRKLDGELEDLEHNVWTGLQQLGGGWQGASQEGLEPVPDLHFNEQAADKVLAH